MKKYLYFIVIFLSASALNAVASCVANNNGADLPKQEQEATQSLGQDIIIQEGLAIGDTGEQSTDTQSHWFDAFFGEEAKGDVQDTDVAAGEIQKEQQTEATDDDDLEGQDKEAQEEDIQIQII